MVAALALGVTLVSASASEKVAAPVRDAVFAIQSRRRAGGAGALVSLSTDQVRVNDAGEVQVYVILRQFRPDLVAALEATGLRVELTLPQFQLVQGWVAADAVNAVAGLDFVREVKPPGYSVPRGR